MKKPIGLKQVIVTLFERDGEPFIRLLFIADNGEECDVTTELDVRRFTINFTDEPDTELPKLPGKPDGNLN